MKKLISLILALVMVFALATVASATETDEEPIDPGMTQDPPLIINKTYKVNNGTAPAETFKFRFTPVSYKDPDGKVSNAGDDGVTFPALADVTVDFAEEVSKTTDKYGLLTIDPDEIALGTYTYAVSEVVPTPKTAGISYHTNIEKNEFLLVLTILRDEQSGKHYVAAIHYGAVAENSNKIGSVVNEYDAGSLSVKKEIKGNMADMDKEFAFTITFTAPTGAEVKSSIIVITPDGGKQVLTFDGESSVDYTINLGDGDTVKFDNLPAGVTYVIEEDNENYKKETNFEKADGVIKANDADEAIVTNTLENPVDTGIVLDSMPYVLLLAVAFFGMAMLTKKRRCEN